MKVELVQRNEYGIRDVESGKWIGLINGLADGRYEAMVAIATRFGTAIAWMALAGVGVGHLSFDSVDAARDAVVAEWQRRQDEETK